MDEPKPKKSAPKFFDVARPGKSAPASTTKPVLITNRPVLQDPMMVTHNSDQAADSAKSTSDEQATPAPQMSHKIKLQPLVINVDDASETVTPGAPALLPALQDEASETSEETKLEIISDTEKSATIEEVDVTETTKLEETPEAPDASELKPIDTLETLEETTTPEERTKEPSAPETPPTVTEAATETPAPEEAMSDLPLSGDTDDITAPSDDSADPNLSEEAQKAEKLVKEQAKAQEKIIADGTFYLPINAIEKRRTKHHIIAGIVLAVVLAIALFLVSWDAGFFSIPGLTAPTNFL
jgi:hypothetical protein